jgi:hypothetical protein
VEASNKFTKFRRPGWFEGAYWYWDGIFLNKKGDGNPASITKDNLLSNDWEEYVEPAKTYTFIEACKRFTKIKRKGWVSRDKKPQQFLLVNKDGSIKMCNGNFFIYINHNDLVAKDWIEHK